MKYYVAVKIIIPYLCTIPILYTMFKEQPVQINDIFTMIDFFLNIYYSLLSISI